ncbi:MAG: hypothetical protein AB8B59_17420 [Maribacter sp.]
MKIIRIFITLILTISVAIATASNPKMDTNSKMETPNDSLRLAELDQFWTELSRTVNDGDFEGYKATYHDDAVVVFTTGENKASMSISKALANWQQDFIDTKAGKTVNSVAFRFSQRVGDATTAHETGIFVFQSNSKNGEISPKQYVHFEALLVKHDSAWLMVMEYQKSRATEEEWELLE